MILVANKIDLIGKVDNWITKEEGIELLNTLTDKYFKSQTITLFMETSALTGENVNIIFEKLGKTLILLSNISAVHIRPSASLRPDTSSHPKRSVDSWAS